MTLSCFLYILLIFKTGKTGTKPRKGRQLVELDQLFFQVTVLIVKGNI